MDEREGHESENPPILKPSNKYKEDNPQAPDKSEAKAVSRKVKGGPSWKVLVE